LAPATVVSVMPRTTSCARAANWPGSLSPRGSLGRVTMRFSTIYSPETNFAPIHAFAARLEVHVSNRLNVRSTSLAFHLVASRGRTILARSSLKAGHPEALQSSPSQICRKPSIQALHRLCEPASLSIRPRVGAEATSRNGNEALPARESLKASKIAGLA
jgi:hypothetical protein